MMRGWIALYRCIIEHWIWNTSSKRLQRWIDLIFLATWQDEKEFFFGKGLVIAKRGQYPTTTRALMKRWNTNNHIVTDTLKLFELAGMISVDRKRNWMVITICNYEKYQFAALKAQSMMKEGDNFDDLMMPANGQNLLPSMSPGMQGSDDFQLQNQLPNEQDNNINNLNNNISSSVREENLKFGDDLKKNDLEIEQACMSLGCEKKRILEMVDAFVNEVNFKETKHDNSSHFKKHFFDWARIELRYSKKNGNERKQSGNQSEDQFKRRRGTDVGNHKASDYGGPFSVRPDSTESV